MLQLEDELLKKGVVSWALGWANAGPIGPPLGLEIEIELEIYYLAIK
uniref:Uncharacterized protein n=1 Tax=Setaria italica TaxID=4555 RepID=K3XUC6_SETIT